MKNLRILILGFVFAFSAFAVNAQGPSLTSPIIVLILLLLA
jgi:hypothetical protein